MKKFFSRLDRDKEKNRELPMRKELKDKRLEMLLTANEPNEKVDWFYIL